MPTRLGNHQRRHSRDYAYFNRPQGLTAGEIRQEGNLLNRQEEYTLSLIIARQQFIICDDGGDIDYADYFMLQIEVVSECLASVLEELELLWTPHLPVVDPVIVSRKL